MRRHHRLSFCFIAACAPLATGCTNAFFSTQILDFIGPNTAVAVINGPIVANSGQAVVLNGNSSYLQSGSGSRTDAITAGFTFLWEVTTIPGGAVAPTLTDANSSQPTFTATTAGAYVVTLTVSNGVESGASTVAIQVN